MEGKWKLKEIKARWCQQMVWKIVYIEWEMAKALMLKIELEPKSWRVAIVQNRNK